MDTMNKYEQQAQDFLTNTNTKLEIEYIGHGPFWEDDKESRDIYRFTIKKDGRQYSSKFGASIVNSGTAKEAIVRQVGGPNHGKIIRKRQAPRAYDILACLTKYDPGTFEDFCAEYGYDTDSRKAEKAYFSVQKEWEGVRRIWNEKEREQLAEIN